MSVYVCMYVCVSMCACVRVCACVYGVVTAEYVTLCECIYILCVMRTFVRVYSSK